MTRGCWLRLYASWRRWPELFVLAALPLILLALNPIWIYSRLCHDPWIYFGHMQNLAGHLVAFGDLYAASRLTVILPGWLVHQLAPPVLANHLLHLGTYYLAIGSLFVVLAETVGRRSALAVCVLCGCHFFFLEAVGWDYADGYTLAYFLAGLACAARACVSSSWRGWMTAAGASVAAMVDANLTSAALAPLVVLFFLMHNRDRQRAPVGVSACYFVLGGAGLLFVLGAISYAINGRFWILATQLAFARSEFGSVNHYRAGMRTWIDNACWLLFPIMAACGAITRLGLMLRRPDFVSRDAKSSERSAEASSPKALRSEDLPTESGLHGMREPQHRRRIAFLFQGQCLAVFAGLFLLQWKTQRSFLQQWYYVSFLLLPVSLLALGEWWSGWLRRLSTTGYRWFCLGLASAMIASAALPWLAINPGGWGRPAMLLAITLAVLAALVPLVSRPRFGAGLAMIVVLAALNGLCRHEFRTKSSFPQFDMGPGVVDAGQAMDQERPKIYRAIYDCAQVAHRIDSDANVWFWFNKGDPLRGLSSPTRRARTG